MRRIAAVAGLFFLLLIGASALVGALVSRALGGGRGAGVLGPSLLGLGILAVAIYAFARAVRRAAGPLGDVMEAAGRVADGDYTARVEPRGVRDVRALGRSFNRMAERLAAHESQRRNLLADIAHELRTPLAIMRGNVEGMLDGLYPLDAEHVASLIEETKVMERLLDDLQTFSSAEVGALRLDREPTAPSDLVDDAVDPFRPHAEAAGISLKTNVQPGLPELHVDPIRLTEVMTNLLSNALRHTPAGGSILVSAERAGERVAFTVSDTGTGIRPEDLPHVFDRFVKSADSGGAGLGLPIAKAIVEAHAGTIRARNIEGAGTEVRVELPTGDAAGDGGGAEPA